MRLLFLLLLLVAGAFFLSPRSPSVPPKVPPLRPGLEPDAKLTAYVDSTDIPKCLRMYCELTGRELLPITNSPLRRIDEALAGRLTRWGWLRPLPPKDTGVSYHADGRYSAAELKEALEQAFTASGLKVTAEGARGLRVRRAAAPPATSEANSTPGVNDFGRRTLTVTPNTLTGPPR